MAELTATTLSTGVLGCNAVTHYVDRCLIAGRVEPLEPVREGAHEQSQTHRREREPAHLVHRLVSGPLPQSLHPVPPRRWIRVRCMKKYDGP